MSVSLGESHRSSKLTPQQESQTNSIDLPEDDPTVLSKLLRFLYGLDYDVTNDLGVNSETSPLPSENPILPPTDLYIHASLYIMSDKYNIKGLKPIASDRFMKLIYQRQSELLHNNTTDDFPSLLLAEIAPAIELIYTQTTAPREPSREPLRSEIVQYFTPHVRRFIVLNNFQELLARLPEFSYDLLKDAVGRASPSTPPPLLQTHYSADANDWVVHNQDHLSTPYDSRNLSSWSTPWNLYPIWTADVVPGISYPGELVLD